MSALLLPALAASSSGQGELYVDDVFSTYLYTGNGSTQTINNGIDLAGKGGLVWIKDRINPTRHMLFDTMRGEQKYLCSNLSSGSATQLDTLTSFSSSGFNLSSDSQTWVNGSGINYTSWTFRKAPKFFDVVTYTGDGAASRLLSHSLGIKPGWCIIKQTNGAGDWWVAGRLNDTAWTYGTRLNLTNAQNGSWSWNTTATQFEINIGLVETSDTNIDGATYVAYLFAHDPSAEGIIQCGSFTTDGSGNATVNLGWEPQWVMFKRSDSAGSWFTYDVMRGWSMGDDAYLLPNSNAVEASANQTNQTATGFATSGLTASATYIYLAIRRPNKPPKTGTQVYSSSTASGFVSAGFPVDLHIGATRTGAASNHAMHARLTGGTKELVTSTTAAEATITEIGFDSMTGLKASLPSGMVNHFFRRARGFFDVVCYTGTGGTVGGSSVFQSVPHSLGAAPELIVVKSRSATQNWFVYVAAIGAGARLQLNQTNAVTSDAGAWQSKTPDLNYFYLGDSANTNNLGATYVAYLFASLAGISKVGSYTGNGSSKTIDCGFSTGARFFLVKATSTTGSWWVYDSARGIVSAADPALQLNSTAAEITSADAVDPASVGIIVNQEATCSINATGVSYIFLAIA